MPACIGTLRVNFLGTMSATAYDMSQSNKAGPVSKRFERKPRAQNSFSPPQNWLANFYNGMGNDQWNYKHLHITGYGVHFAIGIEGRTTRLS